MVATAAFPTPRQPDGPTLVTTFNDEPVLRTASHSPPAAAACLQASLLLRRRIHRLHGGGVGDEQALLAVCHLLDALSHGYADTSTTVPDTVERAAVRLADQLQRTDSHRAVSARVPLQSDRT